MPKGNHRNVSFDGAQLYKLLIAFRQKINQKDNYNMENSIHVFRREKHWIVKKTLEKSMISKASFNERKKAVRFASSINEEGLKIYIHAENGTIYNVV